MRKQCGRAGILARHFGGKSRSEVEPRERGKTTKFAGGPQAPLEDPMNEGQIRYKLRLHYDGADFRGWQAQPGKPTVQGAIEDAVRQLTGERRSVAGAGRTDTGVHATGQVAAVTMPSSWTAPALIRSLNALLPDTIWVQDAEQAPPGFNPRAAVWRGYEYAIGTAPKAASPFHGRWCWPLCRTLDRGAADRAAALLPGEHNFRAFAKSGQPQRGYVCRVFRARWRRWGDTGIVFEVSANRFLHRMVRYLVGTMVDIGLGRRSESDMARLLEANLENAEGDPPPRTLTTSPPAPPQGLFLTRVSYQPAGRRSGSSGETQVPGPEKAHGPAFASARAAFVVAALAMLTGASACDPGDAKSEATAPFDRASDSVPTLSAAAAIPGVADPSSASPRDIRAASSEQVGQPGDQSVSQSRATAIVRAARTVAPAVVSISVRRRERVRRRSFFDDYFLPFRETQGLGSGFVVNPEGTVLTNHHVVDNASEILVTLPDGRDFSARLAGSDAVTDVAVLLLEPGARGPPTRSLTLPVAPLGTASDLMIGEWTVAIGNPFGQLISNPEPSVTAGVVSALGRHIVPGGDDEGFYLGMIQTDAAINPGNSGGPLVNAVGQVIGVNTSILSRSGGSEGLGFAIPIDRALRVARDIIEHGEVQRAWLGIDVDAVEADGLGRSSGVRVARVTPGSPAADAGVREGARLLEAGRNRMATPLDYTAALLDLRAGDTIRLAVEDLGPVSVVAGRLPSAAADRVALLENLEVVTVTEGIRSERRLAASRGALVVTISAELSRATGLAPGDVILAVNNRQIATAEEAASELRRTQRADRLFVLVFERGGRVVRTGLLEWSR